MGSSGTVDVIVARRVCADVLSTSSSTVFDGPHDVSALHFPTLDFSIRTLHFQAVVYSHDKHLPKRLRRKIAF